MIDPTMLEALWEVLDFHPTPLQQVIMDAIPKYQTILVSGGEQSGKSYLSKGVFFQHFPVDIVKARSAAYKFPLVYWLVGADYAACEAEFAYLQEGLSALDIPYKSTKNVFAPGKITIFDQVGYPGNQLLAIIRVKSAKDPRSLRMESPMGVICCEASQLDLESYWRIRGRCAPRNAWLYMAGTMEGSLGWYPSLATQWRYGTENHECSFILPSYANTALYTKGKNDPKFLALKQSMPEDLFAERMLGVPCPPQGRVFKDFSVVRHFGEYEHVPGLPVVLWIDPGYGHPCAVYAAQFVSQQIQVFWELYEVGWIDEEVILHCMQQPWWKDVADIVIDHYAKQHQQGRVPSADIWREKTGIYPRSEQIRDVNARDRVLMRYLKTNPKTGDPGIVFDISCKGIGSEFGAWNNPLTKTAKVYSWKTDKMGDVVGEKPEQINNDGITAVCYGLIAQFGYTEGDSLKRPRKINKRGVQHHRRR